jgi:hypothetical protein
VNSIKGVDIFAFGCLDNNKIRQLSGKGLAELRARIISICEEENLIEVSQEPSVMFLPIINARDTNRWYVAYHVQGDGIDFTFTNANV